MGEKVLKATAQWDCLTKEVKLLQDILASSSHGAAHGKTQAHGLFNHQPADLEDNVCHYGYQKSQD